MGRRCGVLGDPVEHSLSPVLHAAGYAALGLDWSYAAHRVASGGLPDFLAGLDEEWRGLSLTMPLKREAVPLVDELSERARLAGAANTIVLDDDGRSRGDNTDIPGAIAAIRERTSAPLATAAIIGGGATANSVGVERAVDLVASTIPAEAQDQRLVDACGAVPTIFEIVYHPWPTPLVASIGNRVLVSGFDLLLHQAAVQFELFTGEAAPLAAMRTAGERALIARSVS
jgi:shikimate dehydrogenase